MFTTFTTMKGSSIFKELIVFTEFWSAPVKWQDEIDACSEVSNDFIFGNVTKRFKA